MIHFTLLNPAIDTTRGLCEASKLREYHHRTGLPNVSLGSFSEAQGVVDPALLLSRRGGKLPTKRMMERLRFWMMGWATDEELAAALGPAKKRN